MINISQTCYIEEIFQYFMSKDYGMGKLLFTKQAELVKVDKNNNPPPPLLWNCVIKNSLIVLPRNSSNMDIIGIQMHNENDNNNSSTSSNIEFGNRFVNYSWKLDDDDDDDDNDVSSSFYDYYQLHLPPKKEEKMKIIIKTIILLQIFLVVLQVMNFLIV